MSLSTSANKLDESAQSAVKFADFLEFLEAFPLREESLYATVFERNKEIIQTQKPRFAIANLEKILQATFEISSTSGFDRMSLRDLSRQTGMSMGAIYSCINKKEDIALMIADIVRLSSELTREYALQDDDVWTQLEQSIRFHLYASTVLQPWYFFLFFETRTLPEDQRSESVNIEVNGIDAVESVIAKGIEEGKFHTNDARMIANTVVVLLEDWYLKPWKSWTNQQVKQALPETNKLELSQRANRDIAQQALSVEQYAKSILEIVNKLVAMPSN